MAGRELMPAILFRVNGALVPAVRFTSVSIHDVLGAQPNTGTLTFDNRAVHADVGAAIQIGVGDFTTPHLLFAGQVQHLVQTYQSDVREARLTEWPADLIDHVFALNRRRPFASYVNQSASTVASDLIATYAPGCTATYVQAGLPAITINFDGTTPLMDALNQVAQAVGGRTKIDYLRNLHLFIPPEAGIPNPDPITAANPPLNAPPIQFDVDLSQVRTRVYGKGHGEQILVDLAIGETIVPVADVTLFTATGGRALAALTSDGAQTQQWSYTGVSLGGAGTVAGTGAQPSAAPALTATSGTGLFWASYGYAYTFQTAAGESRPSPIGIVQTKQLAAPTTAPTVVPAAGPGLDPGDYTYQVTFCDAVGETTPSLNSNSATASSTTPPTSSPSVQFNNTTTGSASWPPGTTIAYAYTYIDIRGGETTLGPSTSGTTTPYYATPSISAAPLVSLTASGDASIISIGCYRRVGGGSWVKWDTRGNITHSVSDGNTQSGPPPPATNSAGARRLQLSNLPIGPAGTASRTLYRWSPAAPTFRAVTTLDNVATTYTDTTPNASLGAAAPTSNTTSLANVVITGVAVGPSGTTARKVYRTQGNLAQLQLLPTGTTFANNTATGPYTDTSGDGALGANAPSTDTSGLTSVAGQILPGSATLPTAGAGMLPASGWVRAGGQLLRYTAISGNTLTGIPASGTGAITAPIAFGDQVIAVPALLGVTGNTRGAAVGASVCVFVQRDDVAAQTALGQLERNPDGSPTDGIREYMLTDERRNETSLAALCDADLAAFARPTIGVTYATRDPKSRSGQTVHIELRVGATGVFSPTVFNNNVFHVGAYGGTVWGYVGDFTIQDVTITIDPTADPLPRYLVRASSARFTFADLLQRVVYRSV